MRPGQILAPKPRKEVEKGIAAMKEGKLTEAQKHLQAAYKLAPTNADVNWLMGVLYEREENLASAEEYLKRAVSLDPGNAKALAELGEVLRKKNNLAGVRQTPSQR